MPDRNEHSGLEQPEYRSNGFSLDEMVAELVQRGFPETLDGGYNLRQQLSDMSNDSRLTLKPDGWSGYPIIVERDVDGLFGYETREPAS